MLRLKVHSIRSSNKFGPQTIRRIIVKILTTFQLTALNKKTWCWCCFFLFQKDSMSTILLLMTITFKVFYIRLTKANFFPCQSIVLILFNTVYNSCTYFIILDILSSNIVHIGISKFSFCHFIALGYYIKVLIIR